MIDHRSYTHNLRSCELKPEKKSGLTGIRTEYMKDHIFELQRKM